MSLLNQGINQGFSTRLSYDKCAYDDKLQESVGSLNYKLNADQIMNCNACLSVFIAINSTFLRPSTIILLTALLPPPPQPITFMLVNSCISASKSNKTIPPFRKSY